MISWRLLALVGALLSSPGGAGVATVMNAMDKGSIAWAAPDEAARVKTVEEATGQPEGDELRTRASEIANKHGGYWVVRRAGVSRSEQK